MNTARTHILDRIRAATRTLAPRPPAPTGQPIWPGIADPVAMFREEFTAIKGEFITDLTTFLAGFSKIASAHELVPGNASVREADLGVTGCDCLIARTGSIAVSTRNAGGRACSILPPVHLVIARRDQIVPDLADAVALWKHRYGEHWPSNLAIITGPSRTADIEKILVMGAHGPKRLVLHFER